MTQENHLVVEGYIDHSTDNLIRAGWIPFATRIDDKGRIRIILYLPPKVEQKPKPECESR